MPGWKFFNALSKPALGQIDRFAPFAKIDLTAKTPKMKKHSQNIKLLFADFLEKRDFLQ
jgi:hypothetical protein